MFSLKYLGHAGFILEYQSVKLVCDPWLSESGAFLHSWHQFPPNDFIDKSSLYDADYLYISHRHFDHFDKEFLKDFPKSKVTVIIADFLSDTFFNEIKKLGFHKIVELNDWEKFTLKDDFTITMFKDQSLYKIDSLILIEVEGKKILNKNDCHLSEVYFEKFCQQGIDWLFAQFSGAMWYPAAYDYDYNKQQVFSSRVKNNLLKNFIALANGVQAKHVVHYAGPPCFLDEQFFKFNFQENGIFHDQQDVYQQLSKQIDGKLYLLHPGDEITLAGNLQIKNDYPFDFSNKEELLRKYQKKRQQRIQSYLAGLPEADPDLLEKFEQKLMEIFSSNAYIRDKVNCLVRFTITGNNGGDVHVDTRHNNLIINRSSSEEANYSLYLTGKIARLLVEEKERWEDVLLSVRFTAKRNPDLYNWPLFALLQFSKEPKLLFRIEQMMKENEKEKIIVRDGNKQYKIQRYCPHAGEDLRNAVIKNGKLICPRHHWTFDLRCQGVCTFGGNMPLKYEEINEEE